jgi:hypothetical protein
MRFYITKSEQIADLLLSYSQNVFDDVTEMLTLPCIPYQ